MLCSLEQSKPLSQAMSKPLVFSMPFMPSERDKARRAALIAWFEGPPMRGDRTKFMQRTGQSKGRASQLLTPDSEHPFGERAARSLGQLLVPSDPDIFLRPPPETIDEKIFALVRQLPDVITKQRLLDYGLGLIGAPHTPIVEVVVSNEPRRASRKSKALPPLKVAQPLKKKRLKPSK